jgi:DHA2 family multidrug resistance protein
MAGPNTSAPSMPAPLAGGALAMAAIALALGTFMQVLDSTIANVSVPTIAGNLGVSASQGIWIITAFAVANGISVPLTGWLMGRYGVVRTFVGSVILFTIASFLCGIAWSLPVLIGARVLQGAVSGPMIPGSQALLLMIFPANRRSTALAIWSMTALVAPVCGPVLGGWLCDNFHWSWIFLINLPVGAFCAFICWRYMASRETPTRRVPIDTVGLSLLVVWVGALQIVLDTGKEADWFSSPAIVVETIIAGIAFVAWVIWELGEKHPIVDLSLFKSPNFAISTLVFSLSYAVFFGANLLQPLWLQTQMGYVATWAGLVVMPAGIVAVVLSPFVGRSLSKFDARWVATLSMAAFAISFFMRSGFTSQVDVRAMVWPMLVQGIALSTFFVSMVTLVLNGLPPEQTPQASGLTNFARITAGSFAASLATTLWERGETLHQTRLAETVSAASPTANIALRQLQAAGLSAAQSGAALAQQAVGQAFLLSTIDLFRICGWLSVVLIPLIWLTRRAKAQAGAVHAAD